mgnify:CR=1 FL=1
MLSWDEINNFFEENIHIHLDVQKHHDPVRGFCWKIVSVTWHPDGIQKDFPDYIDTSVQEALSNFINNYSN